jgi:hypothetical protein
MAGQIHQIAMREGRSQASVLNTLILEAIYARLSPLSDIARAVAHVHAHGRKSEQVTA